MDTHTLRLLIRSKLADERLARETLTLSGGPGGGEVCDACEEEIGKGSLVIEAMARDKDQWTMQLHVRCFGLWERERRQPRSA